MHFLPAIAGLAAMLTAAPAAAQLFRTYLSIGGNDANPCTVQQPCRLLPAALAAVQAGGEVWMLDSANYNTGPVTIDKAVTLLAVPGALGSVVALGGPAMQINTAAAVTLRNLNVRPFPGNGAQTGIDVIAPAWLSLLDCQLSGFDTGIALNVATGNVTVHRSRFLDNQTGIKALLGSVGVSESLFLRHSGPAVWAVATTAQTSVSITRSHIRSSDVGVAVTTPSSLATVSISASRLEANSTHVLTQSTSGDAWVSLSENVLTVGSVGVATTGAGNSSISMTRNVLSQLGTGVQHLGGGTVESAGNNTMRDNVTDSTGLISVVGGI